MNELMTIEEIAEHFGITPASARRLLSDHGIRQVRGYPTHQVLAIPRLGKGARTDLTGQTEMYTAFEPYGDQTQYRFRSLHALVKRLGGDHYLVEHGDNGPLRTVAVLKRDTRVGGSHVITTLRVPVEALD
jgi:hypothetical protein